MSFVRKLFLNKFISRVIYYLEGVHFFLKDLSVGPFMLLMVLMSYVIGFFLTLIGWLLDIHIPERAITQTIEIGNPALVLLEGGIVMPFLETLIFQTGIIELLQRKAELRKGVIILISAVAFSLAHYPYTSVLFQLWVFGMGIILAYSYVIYQSKPQESTGVAWVIHGLRNTCSFFIIWM